MRLVESCFRLVFKEMFIQIFQPKFAMCWVVLFPRIPGRHLLEKGSQKQGWDQTSQGSASDSKSPTLGLGALGWGQMVSRWALREGWPHGDGNA